MGRSCSSTGGQPRPAYFMTVRVTRRACASSLGPGQGTADCPDRIRRAFACIWVMNSVGSDDSCNESGSGGSLEGGAGATLGNEIEEEDAEGRGIEGLLGDGGGVAVQAEGWTAR